MYPECARGGGVSHLLAEKRGVSFTLLKKMHENTKFSPIKGGGVSRVRPMLDPPLGEVLQQHAKSGQNLFFFGLLHMFLTCQHGH